MADTKNFRIEQGIDIGTTEVVNSSGKIQATAVSTLDTDNISEGSSNTYFTTTRVNNHLADSGSAKTINNATIDGGTF
tara:strand:+ start:693 stop:926 length:234 start_codon:yes stop_codon:yes gene_type:complete